MERDIGRFPFTDNLLLCFPSHNELLCECCVATSWVIGARGWLPGRRCPVCTVASGGLVHLHDPRLLSGFTHRRMASRGFRTILRTSLGVSRHLSSATPLRKQICACKSLEKARRGAICSHRATVRCTQAGPPPAFDRQDRSGRCPNPAPPHTRIPLSTHSACLGSCRNCPCGRPDTSQSHGL